MTISVTEMTTWRPRLANLVFFGVTGGLVWRFVRGHRVYGRVEDLMLQRCIRKALEEETKDGSQALSDGQSRC